MTATKKPSKKPKAKPRAKAAPEAPKESPNPVGRPSELSTMLPMAKQYLLEGKWKDHGVIPSVVGLACFLGKSREAMYQYGRESPEFSDILTGINTMQEEVLLNKGLSGLFNPTITKLVLGKHGYHEKQEVEVKTPDTKTLSDFYSEIQKD